uniref:40S ribosomal protein S12 n=1 Tax=Anthurium amnicola TaxID=1678845 RepID=A0A1D1YP23_9ARAE
MYDNLPSQNPNSVETNRGVSSPRPSLPPLPPPRSSSPQLTGPLHLPSLLACASDGVIFSRLSSPWTTTGLPVPLDRVEKMAGEEGSAVVPETSVPALGEPMDLMTALRLVIKKSLAHDGIARGLHEGAKVIEKHAAQICLLAEDCDQPDYVKLVKALCAEHNVHLITVPSAKTLGEWSGLCKIDSEGKARKVVGCSCVVVKDYGEESEGLHIVQEYVKSH